jgi:Family of unknown function (DUF5522)
MPSKPTKLAKPVPLVEGLDYYLNPEGLMVLTAHYLRARGYCCANACTHCPYTRKEFAAAKAAKEKINPKA